jgi:hypothetical protein
MHFEIVGKIQDIEVIAVGGGIHDIKAVRLGAMAQTKGQSDRIVGEWSHPLGRGALVRSPRHRQAKNEDQTFS